MIGQRIDAKVGHAEATITVECELTGRWVALRIAEKDQPPREATVLLDPAAIRQLIDALKTEGAQMIIPPYPKDDE